MPKNLYPVGKNLQLWKTLSILTKLNWTDIKLQFHFKKLPFCFISYYYFYFFYSRRAPIEGMSAGFHERHSNISNFELIVIDVFVYKNKVSNLNSKTSDTMWFFTDSHQPTHSHLSTNNGDLYFRNVSLNTGTNIISY